MSMSSLIVSLNGWEACKLSEGLVEIKTPNAQVRAICESLGYIPPAHWDLDAFRDQIFTGTRISLEPVTRRSKRKKSNEDLALSPEEKLEANKQAKISRMTAKEEQKRDSAEKKAADVLSKAKKGAESRRNKLLDKAKMRLDKAEAEAKRETTKEKARAVYETEVAKVMTLFEPQTPQILVKSLGN